MAQPYPLFIASPEFGIVQISTANTLRDGTGTMGTVFTAGASGSRILAITITATVTTTAGMIRLFIHDGTNARLWKEVPVSAVTPSGTVAAFTATVDCSDSNPTNFCPLQSGYSLRASTHVTETFNILAAGGDY